MTLYLSHMPLNLHDCLTCTYLLMPLCLHAVISSCLCVSVLLSLHAFVSLYSYLFVSPCTYLFMPLCLCTLISSCLCVSVLLSLHAFVSPCTYLFMPFLCVPSTSLWGVYSETFIHRYNIHLIHVFTRVCMIFFLTYTSRTMPLPLGYSVHNFHF